ncbi:hypothetical protein BDR26DRAFT_862910 [Obelidium mucronatum]|nr:hypothetical protein BDR26DRAFT_862910 [Obelidium mucronatum]
MASDLAAFVREHLPLATVIDSEIDFDESGRSNGTANVRFEAHVDAVQARNVLHGLSLNDQILEVVLAPDCEDVADTGGVVNEHGEYMYKSILDRLGSNRPAPVTEVRKDAAVLDRLGSRILDRLGPTSVYASRGSNRPESRWRSQNSDSNAGRRRKPVRAEDLDAEMDTYMTGEGVIEPEKMDLGEDNSNDIEERYRRPERREFVDFDAPSADPYTGAGGGSRSNRAVLDYGDI